MEPYRAFVADVLPAKEQRRGFLIQSFFTGFGISLANLCLYFFQKNDWLQQLSANRLPYWVYLAFIIGGITSISTVLWAMYKTKENPPTAEELLALESSKKRGLLAPLTDVLQAILHMPIMLWKLALLYLFQWYALFVYWQFSTLAVAQNVYGIPVGNHMNKHANFSDAISFSGLLNATYNIVTFIVALILMRLLARYAAFKLHAVSLITAAIGLLFFSVTHSSSLQLIEIIGLGIAWASIMGVPYLMVVGSIPKEKYGVYMGVINMMIVIPMLIETLSFGYIYKHFLGAVPAHAIAFAAVLFLIAALLCLVLFKPQKATLQNTQNQ
jgi:maltose/moltooligosaccharide transporter